MCAWKTNSTHVSYTGNMWISLNASWTTFIAGISFQIFECKWNLGCHSYFPCLSLSYCESQLSLNWSVQGQIRDLRKEVFTVYWLSTIILTHFSKVYRSWQSLFAESACSPTPKFVVACVVLFLKVDFLQTQATKKRVSMKTLKHLGSATAVLFSEVNK